MAEKIERLEILWHLDQCDHIDLFFADEAGFQLVPNIPYGWPAIPHVSFPRSNGPHLIQQCSGK